MVDNADTFSSLAIPNRFPVVFSHLIHSPSMKCTQGRKVGLTILLQSISHNLSVDPFGVELPSIRWKKKREKRTWEKRNPGNVSVCGVCLGQKNIAQLIKVKERNAAQSFLAKLKKISHVRRCSDLLNLLERKKSSWQSAWKVKAPPRGFASQVPKWLSFVLTGSLFMNPTFLFAVLCGRYVRV